MKKVRKAVFPVAGLGTRFLPATKAIPKEMLTVVDRPVIQYVVDEAREAGIEHFIFVTGRNKAVIEDHFDVQFELYDTLAQRGKDDQLARLQRLQPAPGQTSFTRQQVPLGLGHAVWCARELVGDEPFALLLPDMIMQSEKSCMKDMVDLYAETGNNIIAYIDSKTLSAAADRVSTISTERGRGVKLSFTNGNLTLVANSPDAGSAEDSVEADFDAEPLDIGFNARYLQTLLSTLGDGKTRIELADAGSPTVFKSDANSDLLIVLMPLRV